MSIAKFWQRLRSSHKRLNTVGHAQRPRPRLTVEALEGRLAPAVVVLDLNVLPSGNDGAADTVEARRNGANLELVVNGQLARSQPLAPLTGLSILGSADADHITVASDLGLNAVIDGRGGANDVTVLGTAEADLLTVSSSSISRRGVGGGGSDVVVFDIVDSNHQTPVRIGGGGGGDILVFDIIDSVARNPLRFEGGSGEDTLKYTSHTTPVMVNLAAGTATGFAGGIDGVENVEGGQGNDTLIGNASANRLDGKGGKDLVMGGAGDDWLSGGAGNDIVIGGTGGDRLEGDADDDLMIGGSTTFDANVPVLSSMRDLWGNPGMSYQQRIDELRTVGVGGYRLDTSHVLPDGANDWLSGGTGQDWFWVDALDFLLDQEAREQRN